MPGKGFAPPGSDSWLAALVRGSFDAMVGMSRDGVVVSWNLAAERIYGYSEAEAVGRHISLIFPDTRRAELEENWRRLLRGETIAPYETVRQRKDGALVDVFLTLSPVLDERGRTVAAWQMAQDVTDKKRAVEALQASESRFREIAANFPGVIFRRVTYPDGRIEYPYMSEAAERILKVPLAWTKSARSMEDLAAFIEREDLEYWRGAIADAAERLVPLEIEGRVRGADGRMRWVRSISRPHRRADGAVVWDGVLLDVTERKQAQEALRQRDAELKVIMETVPAIIWLAHDPEAKRITGSRYAAERLRLRPDVNQSLTAPAGSRPAHFRVLRDGIELAPEDLPVQRAARGEEIEGEEVEVAFDDGSSFWEFINASPVRDATGRVVGAVGAGVDITERKAAEERQAMLVAELDHRVRNILATVQSMVRLTADNSPTKDTLARTLEGRIGAMTRAHDRLTRGSWRGADLSEIVQAELEVFSDNGDRFMIDGTPNCMLKPRQALNLALVLHELATNAAKHGALSGNRGSVRVSWRIVAEHEPHSLRIEWREKNGPPVVPPTQRGFGSRLIESALAADGAKVVFAFDPRGIRCVIDLPFTAVALIHQPGAEAGANPAEPSPRAERADLTGIRVLLAEDEPVVGLEIQAAVIEAGAEVVGRAQTLRQALDIAARESLSAAVLDVNLDGEMVFPLAEVLKARGVPILFVTGYDLEDIAPKAFGDALVLRKPVQTDSVVHWLDQLKRQAGLDALRRAPLTPATGRPGRGR